MTRTVTTVETQRWDADKSEWVPESKGTTTVDETDLAVAPKVVPVPYPVYPYQPYQITPYWVSTTRTIQINSGGHDTATVGQAISDTTGSAYSGTYAR